MSGNKEGGYVLFECLVGLVLLGLVSMSLVLAMPTLLEHRSRLDHEAAIYHKLFELHMSNSGESEVTFNEPLDFYAYRDGYLWCAVWIWRESSERIICL